MSKRAIITIDEDKCNGCGLCTSACAEGALKLVNGKAKLVKELYCDGLGDCVGECPTGALKVLHRHAPDFDLAQTRAHVLRDQGDAAARRLEEVQRLHEKKPHAHPREPPAGGCPGTRMRFAAPAAPPAAVAPSGATATAIRSELTQWPVQLHLVQPGAPFFKDRELVVLSTCSPIASADVHWRFIRGRGVTVGCPKLDDTGEYAEKLGQILAEPTIPKVLVVRMEVPCCGGLTAIVRQAIELSGRKDLVGEEVVVGLGGEIRSSRTI